MKVWITKYALTDGILACESAFRDGNDSGAVFIKSGLHFKRGEWHRTEEEAIAHAKKMQSDRIALLTKSLEKVKALDFGGAKYGKPIWDNLELRDSEMDRY
jgi:hypothetical protein